MAKADLTAERLREILHYDPETGVFTWRVKANKRINIGDTAGRINHHGYVVIGVYGNRWQAHRLAWLYTTGSVPKDQVDHINGVRSDNRISNLRDVSGGVNQQNRRSSQKHNRLGIMGVVSQGSGYMARIRVGGILHRLGTFKTPELAHAAYLSAKREMHSGSTI